MYSISSLSQGSRAPRSALKDREHPGKQSTRSCAPCLASPASLFCADHSGIRRSGLTLVKSPGSSDHYLFLARRKPKARSNCIINIIAVGEPIILCLSVSPVLTLNYGLLADERVVENLSNCSSQICCFELFLYCKCVCVSAYNTVRFLLSW